MKLNRMAYGIARVPSTMSAGVMVLCAGLVHSQVNKTTQTLIIDPCKIVSKDQLTFLLSRRIKPYFPLKYDKDVEYVAISDAVLANLTCPNLKVSIKTHIHYEKTRGFPQFTTSGEMDFKSPLVARVVHTVKPNGVRIQAADVRKATACFTDVQVTYLDLKNVPGWLDNTWIRNYLNQKLPNQVCLDITGLVKAYLRNGGTL